MLDVADVDTCIVHPPFVLQVLGLVEKFSFRRREFSRGRIVRRAYARQIQRRGAYDLIFSPSSMLVSMLPVEVKRAFWTDAVYSQVVDYYPGQRRLSKGGYQRGVQAEIDALAYSDAYYASRWARDAALELSPSADASVTYFGPNLSTSSIERVRALRAARPWRTAGQGPGLLWIGVDWTRKGGQLAVDALDSLRTTHAAATLTVVGVDRSDLPLEVAEHEGVTVVGRLSKWVESELRALESLLAVADVLLLPSKAEMAGIVVLEAGAVGLPSVVCDVGGLGEMVDEFRLGEAVSVDATGAVFAEAIARVVGETGLDPAVMHGVAGLYAQAARTIVAGAVSGASAAGAAGTGRQ